MPEFLILFERLHREYMTVVRVFFKTNVTVSAVTVSVVKTNVFSTLEGTWVCNVHLHYMAGLGRAWTLAGIKLAGPKNQRPAGPGRASIFRPVQGSSGCPLTRGIHSLKEKERKQWIIHCEIAIIIHYCSANMSTVVQKSFVNWCLLNDLV